jgi:hypothetical protein
MGVGGNVRVKMQVTKKDLFRIVSVDPGRVIDLGGTDADWEAG